MMDLQTAKDNIGKRVEIIDDIRLGYYSPNNYVWVEKSDEQALRLRESRVLYIVSVSIINSLENVGNVFLMNDVGNGHHLEPSCLRLKETKSSVISELPTPEIPLNTVEYLNGNQAGHAMLDGSKIQVEWPVFARLFEWVDVHPDTPIGDLMGSTSSYRVKPEEMIFLKEGNYLLSEIEGLIKSLK